MNSLWYFSHGGFFPPVAVPADKQEHSENYKYMFLPALTDQSRLH